MGNSHSPYTWTTNYFLIINRVTWVVPEIVLSISLKWPETQKGTKTMTLNINFQYFFWENEI